MSGPFGTPISILGYFRDTCKMSSWRPQIGNMPFGRRLFSGHMSLHALENAMSEKGFSFLDRITNRLQKPERAVSPLVRAYSFWIVGLC